MTPSKPPSHKDDKSANSADFDDTAVDLGEDLLSTQTQMRAPKSAAAFTPSEILRNASILLREGFVDDAKKNLRSILAQDPGHAHAAALLKRIHDRELKQMLSDPGSSRPDRNPVVASQVIDKLEQDLGIEPDDEEAVALSAPSFEGEPKPHAPADLMDLGVALMEMGLFHQAIPRFEEACRALEGGGDVSKLIEAASLLAYARVRAGSPFEATVALEHLLRDTDIPHEAKLDLFYLMGRAYEALKMKEPARQWYMQAHAIDARYRDIEERLK